MTATGDGACQELVERVTEYLDGALPPHERRRFEVHVAGCDGCDVHLARMRATIALTGSLREQDVDPRTMARLTACFRDWHGTRG